MCELCKKSEPWQIDHAFETDTTRYSNSQLAELGEVVKSSGPRDGIHISGYEAQYGNPIVYEIPKYFMTLHEDTGAMLICTDPGVISTDPDGMPKFKPVTFSSGYESSREKINMADFEGHPANAIHPTLGDVVILTVGGIGFNDSELYDKWYRTRTVHASALVLNNSDETITAFMCITNEEPDLDFVQEFDPIATETIDIDPRQDNNSTPGVYFARPGENMLVMHEEDPATKMNYLVMGYVVNADPYIQPYGGMDLYTTTYVELIQTADVTPATYPLP